jgi:hypothetical protein
MAYMNKIGFDIDEYRKEAQHSIEHSEDMEIKRKANDIAAENVKIARLAFLVSAIAAAISLAALAVSILNN